MLKIILFAVFLFVCSPTFIQNELNQSEPQALPRLPLYVGRGYHILYGNPKSDKLTDPGFFDQIFDFTYIKNFTNPDHQYLVPDQAVSQELQMCSLTTTVNEFRGTKSYQDNLQSISKIASGSRLYDYRFSKSGSYQRVQNSTSSFKEIVHSEALCEYNQILINRNELPSLTSNFISTAVQANKNANWKNFIATFGTHYAYDVTLGARAVEETVYTYEGISKMGGVQMDIPLAAKASFAKYFNDSSFDFRKYQTLISYSESSSFQKFQFYTGVPPVDGNVSSWYSYVKKSPSPISYKLAPISELLTLIKDPTFDLSSALYQLSNAIDNECIQFSCKNANADFPSPTAASSQIDMTAVYGNFSASGSSFKDFENSTTKQLRQLYIRFTSNVIHALKLLISDGITERWTVQAGGNGGSDDFWRVPSNESITKVWMKYNGTINCLQFITDKGTASPIYGHNYGVYKEINIPTGYRIVGFLGKVGSYLDTLGFYIAKTIYPPIPTEVEVLKIEIQ